MKRLTLIFLVALILVSGLLISAPYAVERNSERSSLKGLGNFGVVVEETVYDKKGNEEKSDSYQTEVELKFRTAGIKILSKGDWVDDNTTPVLKIESKLLEVNPMLQILYVYNISLTLYQPVILERDPEIGIPAITWTEKRWGMIDYTDKAKFPKKIISDLINEFMNEYLAENPKE